MLRAARRQLLHLSVLLGHVEKHGDALLGHTPNPSHVSHKVLENQRWPPMVPADDGAGVGGCWSSSLTAENDVSCKKWSGLCQHTTHLVLIFALVVEASTMVSPTAALAAARTITRVSARAFVHPKVAGGGNPVDVFLVTPASPSDSNLALPSDTRSRLAQTCEWESVVAHLPSSSAGEQGQRPVLSFHMPSGEEVSFCAHAALGAASVISQEAEGGGNTARKAVEFTTTTDESVQSVSISPETGEAELTMNSKLVESDIPDFITLGHVREAIGLRMEDISLGGTGLPSYINSSIARNKTLMPMLEEKRLQVGPKNPDPVEWQRLCDKIDSTGVYLYCPVDKDSMEDDEAGKGGGDVGDDKDEDDKDKSDEVVLRYECRQFPRASGYPEDPATGIAAAALAASLRKRGFGAPKDDKDTKQYRFEFYQGTSMGRRSKIGVRFDPDCDVKSKDKDISIYISGLVDISSRKEEELP